MRFESHNEGQPVLLRDMQEVRGRKNAVRQGGMMLWGTDSKEACRQYTASGKTNLIKRRDDRVKNVSMRKKPVKLLQHEEE